jgi:hypothetical protein
MQSKIAEVEILTEVDEFDLDLRLDTVEISDQPAIDIHASGSCTCSHNRTCTCYSQCSCQTCSCSCGCDDDDDW